MKTCFFLLFWVCLSTLMAQPIPGPDEFVLLDKEPDPINYAKVASTVTYPKAAYNYLVEGKVLARILVDTSGLYRKHVILKSPHPALEEAVAERLPELRFKPAEYAGQKRTAWVTLPFEFKIDLVDINVEKEKEVKAPDSLSFKLPDGSYRTVANPIAESYAATVKAIGYPKKAYDRMIDGKVIVEVQFDDWGKYVANSIVRSDHPILEKAVVEKLDLLYMNPNPDGSPVGPARITIPFSFVLYSSGL
jgi:TonB family protein